MNHSNSTIRTRTIWKAILLTVLPMVFSGLAVYLLMRTDGLYQKQYQELNVEMEGLEKEKGEFTSVLNQMNTNWSDYMTNNDKFIKNQDSSSIENIKLQIDRSGTLILQNLSPTRLVSKDSIYSAILTSSKENFDAYLKDMRKFRRYKEQIDRGLSGGKCCEDLRAYEQEVENEIEELEEEKRRLEALVNEYRIDNRRLNLCEDRERDLEREVEELGEELENLEQRISRKFLRALSDYRDRRLREDVITSIIEDLELRWQ
ncbi:MAG: hypothetical protein AAGG68_04735 [Bacteroidota bacterium]